MAEPEFVPSASLKTKSPAEQVSPDSGDTWFYRALIVFGLYGMAFAHPVLDMVGGNPELISFHNLDALPVLAMTISFAVVPPLVLAALSEALRVLHRTVGGALHLLVVGALAAVAVFDVAKTHLGLLGAPLVLVGACAGLIAALTYVRWTAVGEWFRLFAIVPLASLLLFWAFSSSGQVLRAERTDAAPIQSGDKPSVVVLLLDELPTKSILDSAGGVDSVRFPNLAELADTSDWFANNTTTASLTSVAAPTALASSLDSSGPPFYTQYPDNLFSMMDDTHQLRVFESFTKLCAASNCTGESDPSDLTGFGDVVRELIGERYSTQGYERGVLDDFAEKTERAEEAEKEEADRAPVFPALENGEEAGVVLRGIEATTNQPVRFRSFVDSIERDEPATLHFLHILLPHQPWRYYGDGQVYATPLSLEDTYPFSRTNDEAWTSTISEYRHLQQVSYVDGLVGEMVDHMKATDTWDDSVVVVMADHGISFESGTSIRTLTPGSIDSIAYAPLFIKRPNQQSGGRNDANVSLLDVIPTIADLVGIEPDFPMAGLPVDDSAVADRGDNKSMFNILDEAPPQNRGLIDFSMSATAPRSEDRWVGSLTEGDSTLAPLHKIVGVTDRVGAPLDPAAELPPGDIVALVDQLDALSRPDSSIPVGLVVGEIKGTEADHLAVLLVDGLVQGASPLFPLGGSALSFTLVVPQELLIADKEIQIATLEPDGSWRALPTMKR